MSQSSTPSQCRKFSKSSQSVPNTWQILSNKFVMFRTSCRQRNTKRLTRRNMRTSVKAPCGSETVKKLISNNQLGVIINFVYSFRESRHTLLILLLWGKKTQEKNIVLRSKTLPSSSLQDLLLPPPPNFPTKPSGKGPCSQARAPFLLPPTLPSTTSSVRDLARRLESPFSPLFHLFLQLSQQGTLVTGEGPLPPTSPPPPTTSSVRDLAGRLESPFPPLFQLFPQLSRQRTMAAG